MEANEEKQKKIKANERKYKGKKANERKYKENKGISIEGNLPGQQRAILQRKEVLGATLMLENIDNGTPAREEFSNIKTYLNVETIFNI